VVEEETENVEVWTTYIDVPDLPACLVPREAALLDFILNKAREISGRFGIVPLALKAIHCAHHAWIRAMVTQKLGIPSTDWSLDGIKTTVDVYDLFRRP
jgi:hypothetical protein